MSAEPNLSDYGQEVALSFKQMDALLTACEKAKFSQDEHLHFCAAMLRIGAALDGEPTPELTDSGDTVPLTVPQMEALRAASDRVEPSMPDFKEALRRIVGVWCEGDGKFVGLTEDEKSELVVKMLNRSPTSPFQGMINMESE